MFKSTFYKVSIGLALINIKTQWRVSLLTTRVFIVVFLSLIAMPALTQESALMLPDAAQYIGEDKHAQVLDEKVIGVKISSRKSFNTNAEGANRLGVPIELFNNFSELYKEELGSITPCNNNIAFNEYKVCSEALRNEGNAPFILYSKGQLTGERQHGSHIEVTQESKSAAKHTFLRGDERRSAPIVVLFHGLSDSPFFVRGIAQHLNNKGFTVVAPLTPGNGKRDAVVDMKDPNLKKRWYAHVDKIMALVKPYSDTTFIGGFSTGGTLATRYMLLNPDSLNGLLLFSGALALSDSAENLGIIWGMKWLAKMFDGEFVSAGPHPYRYPDVAGYAGLMSADVIFEVRDLLQTTSVSTPIFMAHSLADVMTPFYGVENLLADIKGEHQAFTIDVLYDTCHQDLVVSPVMMIDLKVDKTQLNISERCAIPKPNPLFRNMMAMLDYYFTQQLNDE